MVEPGAAHAPRRAAVVDDNADDRALVARALRREFPGVEVVEVNDAASLDAALDRDDVDVWITDYQLLWTDGLRVVAAVRTRHPDAPVIMFTNTGSEPVAVAAMKAGAYDYVVKEAFQYARLPSVVRSALELREARRAARRRREEAAAHERRLGALLREVSASEARYRAMGEAIAYGVWLAGPDGGAQYFSRSFLDLAQMTMAQAAGLGWTAALRPEDAEATRRAWAEAVAAGADWEAELRVVDRRGDERTVLNRGRPIRDEAGVVLGWAGVNLDITGRKAAERERDESLARERAARREAEQASRLKDEFLATVSHELRTPLNAILGWSALLADAAPEPDAVRRGLAAVERNARAQLRLVEDLLDAGRLATGKLGLELRALDLAAAVAAAAQAVAPAAAARGVRLRAPPGEPGVVVRGDPARLHQVFVNLLDNAVKFSPEGGEVDVRLARAGGDAEVRVADRGVGIDASFLPRVFDPFRQADGSTTRRFGGLGLGLAIAKDLVELHGGRIEARSEGPGRGATFAVRLPLAAGAAAAPETAGRGSPRGEPLGGLVIVAVDDDRDACELVARVLEHQGATVHAALTAGEAFELVRDLRPDALVSDVGMPGEDGYALVARVRALGPGRGGDVPAVALTAFARAEDRELALAAGFQRHLTKPLAPAELVAAIAALARRAPPPGGA